MLGVPLKLQEFSSGKMLRGFSSPAPATCSLPLLSLGFASWRGWMVCFEGFKLEAWGGHVAASDAP